MLVKVKGKDTETVVRALDVPPSDRSSHAWISPLAARSRWDQGDALALR